MFKILTNPITFICGIMVPFGSFALWILTIAWLFLISDWTGFTWIRSEKIWNVRTLCGSILIYSIIRMIDYSRCSICNECS